MAASSSLSRLQVTWLLSFPVETAEQKYRLPWHSAVHVRELQPGGIIGDDDVVLGTTNLAGSSSLKARTACHTANKEYGCPIRAYCVGIKLLRSTVTRLSVQSVQLGPKKYLRLPVSPIR